jgi:hypothetical protein
LLKDYSREPFPGNQHSPKNWKQVVGVSQKLWARLLPNWLDKILNWLVADEW